MAVPTGGRGALRGVLGGGYPVDRWPLAKVLTSQLGIRRVSEGFGRRLRQFPRRKAPPDPMFSLWPCGRRPWGPKLVLIELVFLRVSRRMFRVAIRRIR